MNLLNYITGRRKGKAARRIEIDAMRDPFLADALEGYDKVKANHADIVAALQKQVSQRTAHRPTTLWLISACSAAAVTLFAFYFVMQAPELPAENEDLFVYIPENYMRQNTYHNPNVEIENLSVLELDVIDIYVPDSYVEQKQLAVYEAEAPVTGTAPATDIVNLDEFFAPEEPIKIYLPDSQGQRVPPEIDIIQIN